MLTVRTADPKKDLPALVEMGAYVSIAAAFVSLDGLRRIEKQIKNALSRGSRFRILIDLISDNTEPQAVQKLTELSSSSRKFEVKAHIPIHSGAIFHHKLYLANGVNEDHIVFMTGSYNLTDAAFKRNVEHGLWVECDGAEPIGHQTLQVFNDLWKHPRSVTIDEELANSYADGWKNNADVAKSSAARKGFNQILKQRLEAEIEKRQQSEETLNKLSKFRQDFWKKYSESYPKDFRSRRLYRGSNVNHKTAGLVISQFLAQKDVGIYIRPRNLDFSLESKQRAQSSGPILEQMGLHLESNPNSRELKLLTKLPIDDSTNRDNWPKMIEWLHDKLQIYRGTVGKKNA